MDRHRIHEKFGPRARAGVAIVVLILAVGATVRSQDKRPSVVVPADLQFANGFIDDLGKAGFVVEKVAHSKLNGGELISKNAVWVKTDKGTLEAVFYSERSQIDVITIRETDFSDGFHTYAIDLDSAQRHWTGKLPTFFTKYGLVLMVSYEPELRSLLDAAFADKTVAPN